MRHCDEFEDAYDGRTIGEIEGLRDTLKEVGTDFLTWTTTYVCQICGRRWVEKYEERGHGEVPSVYKAPMSEPPESGVRE